MKLDAGYIFMKDSQLTAAGREEYKQSWAVPFGIPQPPLELPAPEGECIPLPEPHRDVPVDLFDLISGRSTTRVYSPEPLTLDELSYLLWCTQGIKRTLSERTLRTVPSAGARHPFETHLLVNRVEGLEAGLYRYVASQHALYKLEREEGFAEKMHHATWEHPMVPGSAVTFYWVAVTARTHWRYGSRGFRYMLLDAGHVCQNLYLAAGAIGLGVCAIGSWYEEEIEPLLGLDGREKILMYAAAVGRRPVKGGE